MLQTKWGMIVTLVTITTLSLVSPVSAHPSVQPPPPIPDLSPYWGPAIQQWEAIILENAHRRGLDPDLIAAVIWKESLGQPRARGPAGAVGLMMVMPREAGFSWRPPAAALEDPSNNVFWGTRTLSIVIRQSHGDLYQALAAYNGGWEQIHLRAPRLFAHDVLGTYARAVAVRCGLSPEGHWVATVAAMDEGTRTALTVFGPQRSFARYSNRPVAAHIPDATTAGPPTTVVFWPADGKDLESRVGLWLMIDGRTVPGPEPQPFELLTARTGSPEALVPSGGRNTPGTW